MSDEKRISVSFGAFAVDIEGYDDPFAVLSSVISHIKSSSDAPLGQKGFAAEDLENAALLASLSASAARLELTGDEAKPRLRVTPDVEPADYGIGADLEDNNSATASAAPLPPADEPPHTLRLRQSEQSPATQTAAPLADANLRTPEEPAAQDSAPAEPAETTEETLAEPAITTPEQIVDTMQSVAPTDDPEEIADPEPVEAAANFEDSAVDPETTATPQPVEPPVAVSELKSAPVRQEDDVDEEAAILRRVRRAIRSADDDADEGDTGERGDKLRQNPDH